MKKKESKWFERNIGNHNIHIPIEIARNLKLEKDNKVAIKIKYKNFLYLFPARIGYRIKKDGNCFRFQITKTIQKNLNGKVLVKIIKLNRPRKINIKKDEIDLTNFSNNSSNIVEWLNNKSFVIWDNKKYPLIITRKINALNFAKYLGLYYADGGKTSHYTCCCSTIQIAKLALNCYKRIIKNPKYTAVINYRKLTTELNKSIIHRITNHWSKLIPIPINNIKLTGNKKTFQWSNNLGILALHDSRVLSLNLHNWLIKEVLKLGDKNNKILEEFLKGGLLGDGTVSNRRKDSFMNISISSNNQEYFVWESICKKLGFQKCYIIKNKKVNSVNINFGSFYDGISLYKKGIFKEHRKRREKLLNGLKNRVETHIAKKLLNSNFNKIPIKGKFGSKTPSFFYVHKGGDLIKNNLIVIKDKNVQATDKGKQFINDLVNLKIING